MLKSNNIFKIIFVFLTIIPKLILANLALPMYAPSDEAWMIGSLVKLCGYNWEGIMQNSSYYGIGFSILFIPIIQLIKNPIYMYRIILCIYVFANFFIAILCYKILQNYFNVSNKIICMLLSVSASYAVVLPIVYMYNEHVLSIIVWILLYLLLVVSQEGVSTKKKKVLTFVIVLVLTYSLTIHTRALTFWLGTIVLVLLVKYVYKRWILDIPIFFVIGSVSLILVNYLINKFVENTWITNGNTQEIHNVSVPFETIGLFFNIKYWKTIFLIIFGQINAGFIFTGCISIISIVMCYVILKKHFLCKTKNMKEEFNYFILVIFLGIQIIGTIFMQSVSWVENVLNAINMGNTWSTHLRAFSYIRYYFIYAAPIIIVSIFWSQNNILFFVKNRKKIFFVVILNFSFYLKTIIPIIQNNYQTIKGNSANVFLPFVLKKIENGKVDYNYFFPSIVFAIISCFILYFFIKKYKIYCLVLFSFIIFMLQYTCRGGASINIQKQNYTKVENMYEIVQQIRNDKVRPNIYFFNNQDIYSYYELQFLAKDLKITLVDGYIEEDKFVLFSLDKQINLNEICTELQLENGGYVYLKDYDIFKGRISE